MEKEKLAKEAQEMEKIAKSAMEKQLKKEKLLNEEKERLVKELKIADSLIVEENNCLKQAISTKSRKMEYMYVHDLVKTYM